MRVVTIDGPAGAGKSTVARRLADRLGWRLLDTGAMYRAVALAAIERGVPLDDSERLAELAETLVVELPADGRVLLDGRDITRAIRSVVVTEATRFSAAAPRVRRILVGWQRAFAEGQAVVAEGRDQGTVVFPDAPRKFFLTATAEERARRRHRERLDQGETVAFADVLAEQAARDARDEARAVAPLRPADDARRIDTTGMDLDAVVRLIEDDLRATE